MEKEIYAKPAINIIRLAAEDIIVTSNGTGPEPYGDDFNLNLD